ncbi:MAG: CPBP family intramembrane glutamic endopeptidase, partial [bacterium]
CGGWKRWGWGMSATLRGCFLLSVVTAMILLANGSESSYSAFQIIIGWLATMPVALFEEAAFRSLLFLSLREQMSPLKAALLSSLIFAVFHIEAQPVYGWPDIFVYGLGACAALHNGVGLAWLILSHLLVDGIWYHFNIIGHISLKVLLVHRITVLVTIIVSIVLLWKKTHADSA